MTIKQIKVRDKMVENGGAISGKELKEIGYSDAIVHTPSKVTNSPKIQASLQQLLAKKGITLDAALNPIKDALKATKTAVHGQGKDALRTEEIDHTTRLKASDMSLKLLKTIVNDIPPTPVNNDAILEAIRNGDVVRLQQIVFEKSTD